MSKLPIFKIGITFLVVAVLVIVFAAGAFADLQRAIYTASHGSAPPKDFRLLQCTVKVENALLLNDGKINAAACSKGLTDIDQYECAAVPGKTFFFGNEFKLVMTGNGAQLATKSFTLDEPPIGAPATVQDVYFSGCVPKTLSSVVFTLQNSDGSNVATSQPRTVSV